MTYGLIFFFFSKKKGINNNNNDNIRRACTLRVGIIEKEQPARRSAYSKSDEKKNKNLKNLKKKKKTGSPGFSRVY